MRVFSTQNRTRVQIPDQPGASGNVWDNKPSGFFHAASAKLVGDLGERSRSGGTRNRPFRGGDSLGWMLRIGTVIRIRCASSRGWGYFGVGMPGVLIGLGLALPAGAGAEFPPAAGAPGVSVLPAAFAAFAVFAAFATSAAAAGGAAGGAPGTPGELGTCAASGVTGA